MDLTFEYSDKDYKTLVLLTNKALRYFGLYDVPSLVGICTFLVLMTVLLTQAGALVDAMDKVLTSDSSYGNSQAQKAANGWLRFNQEPLEKFIHIWHMQPLVMVLDSLAEAVITSIPVEDKPESEESSWDYDDILSAFGDDSEPEPEPESEQEPVTESQPEPESEGVTYSKPKSGGSRAKRFVQGLVGF